MFLICSNSLVGVNVEFAERGRGRVHKAGIEQCSLVGKGGLDGGNNFMRFRRRFLYPLVVACFPAYQFILKVSKFRAIEGGGCEAATGRGLLLFLFSLAVGAHDFG